MQNPDDAGKENPAPDTECELQGLGGSKGIARSIPRSSSVKSVKKFTPERRRTHSKKAVELDYIRNVARGQLAAGMPVSETRLFELVGCPRFSGDGLRAMKQLHKYYPDGLRLVLKNGTWWLEPVTGADEP
jgi:hypothetical protein